MRWPCDQALRVQPVKRKKRIVTQPTGDVARKPLRITHTIPNAVGGSRKPTHVDDWHPWIALATFVSRCEPRGFTPHVNGYDKLVEDITYVDQRIAYKEAPVCRYCTTHSPPPRYAPRRRPRPFVSPGQLTYMRP